ncbi:MAG: hypothetical protein ACRC5T_00725 [Cetobacterium sp.]
MENTKYNGWTNRSTWNWNNHLMCTEERVIFLRSLSKEIEKMENAELRALMIEVVGSKEVDGDGINEVNISEIKEALKDI